MTALSALDGKKLWTAPHAKSGHNSPEDLLVVGGLAWCGEISESKQSGVFTGRDPWTGVVKNEFAPDTSIYFMHHRCYRAKATDNYRHPVANRDRTGRLQHEALGHQPLGPQRLRLRNHSLQRHDLYDAARLRLLYGGEAQLVLCLGAAAKERRAE